MRTSSRPRNLLAWFVASACGLALVAGLAQAAPGDGTDPNEEPVPLPEYVDDARSFVTAIDFSSPTSGAGASVVVAQVATPGTAHLKADVVVRSESEGQLVSSFTTPHPAMSFADRVGYFFQAGRYDLLAPFDATVDTLRLTSGGTTIATVDTTAAVRQFCIDNPSDPSCLEADLAVTAVVPTGPLFSVPNRPITVTVDSTVSNLGPDGPVDGRVTRDAVPAAGLTVAPATAQTSTLSLAVGTPQTVRDSWTVTCTAAGRHVLTVTTAVTPRLARVVDSVPGNDSRTSTFTVDCAVPVTINIQPGSTVNPVSLSGSTLPIAVLTTRAGEYGLPQAFNATTIAATTLRFGSESGLLASRGVPEIHNAIHPQDSYELNERTRDGDLDALTHFRPRKQAIAMGDTRACVFGRTTVATGSLSFFGCDTVRVQK